MTDQPQALVADDDLGVRWVLCEMLSNLGFATVEAGNGHELLTKLTDRTSIAFLDLSMPEMDGIEVLRTVGSTGITTPFVLMSGAHSDLLAVASSLGTLGGLSIVDTLSKPISFEQLARVTADLRENAGDVAGCWKAA